MTKIVILSYFFPPANYTAANRIGFWAKHLNEYGIYPIVITKNWHNGSYYHKDYYTGKLEDNIRIDKLEGYEVHYVPGNDGFLFRYLNKFGKRKYDLFAKLLAFVYFIYANLFTKYTAYKNIDKYTSSFFELHSNEIKSLLVSVNPFPTYRIGVRIKKKFGIPLLIDYRDDWSTNNIGFYDAWHAKLINRPIDRFIEKRLSKDVDTFITVSEKLLNRITKITDKQGHLVMNGYNNFKGIVPNIDDMPIDFNKFIILNSGALFYQNKLEEFLDSFVSFYLNTSELKDKIQLVFLGGNMKPYIKSCLNKYKELEGSLLISTDRVDIESALYIQSQADVFLYLIYQNEEDILASKLFDYMQFKKPILVAPIKKDNNHFNFLEDLGLGLLFTSYREMNEGILRLQALKNEGKNLIDLEIVNHLRISQFSRRSQLSELVKVLNSLL